MRGVTHPRSWLRSGSPCVISCRRLTARIERPSHARVRSLRPTATPELIRLGRRRDRRAGADTWFEPGDGCTTTSAASWFWRSRGGIFRRKQGGQTRVRSRQPLGDCKALPEPRPLLHLPELARLPEGAWVFVVEGEACVDAARAIGVVATTSAGGSQAASKSDWAVMKGKIVVVVPDHDAAGDKYAGDVVRLCLAAGAAEVRVVHLVEQWTGLPPGGDIVDALASEGGDAEAVRSKIDALAVAAQPVAPGETPDIAPDECPRFEPAVCFPGAVGDVADFFADVARSTQTPPEMAALLGLAIASACICNVACVRGHGDHIEPAPLWALVLSEPGTRKSAVLSELLKPVLTWEADKAREMRPLIAAAVQRHRITERRMRTLEEKAAKADDPDKRALLEGETIRIAQEMGSSPVPTAPVLLASEPTPEALVRQMKENQGRALLASAEGDALDIVQGRYSGRAKLRRAAQRPRGRSHPSPACRSPVRRDRSPRARGGTVRATGGGGGHLERSAGRGTWSARAFRDHLAARPRRLPRCSSRADSTGRPPDLASRAHASAVIRPLGRSRATAPARHRAEPGGGHVSTTPFNSAPRPRLALATLPSAERGAASCVDSSSASPSRFTRCRRGADPAHRATRPASMPRRWPPRSRGPTISPRRSVTRD
jgi:hypothetical protein